MRKVVNPRQQAKGEEEGGNAQQFGKGPPRPLQDGPTLEELHKQAGQDPELAASRAHLKDRGVVIRRHRQEFPVAAVSANLCSVGQEDGGGQVACDAAQHVDEGDPEPAGQLLNVPQHGHLEEHRHQAVQDAVGREQSLVNTEKTSR